MSLYKQEQGVAHLVLVVGIAVVLVGGTGSVLAADSSRPGDALFSLDRGLEKAQLAMVSMSDEAKAQTSYEHAQERLDELQQLQNEGADPGLVQAAASNYGAAISDAAQALGEAAQDGDIDDELANLVGKATQVHLDVLAEVHEQVPDQAKDAIEQAMENSENSARDSLQTLNGQMPDEVRSQVEEKIEASKQRRSQPESLPDQAENGASQGSDTAEENSETGQNQSEAGQSRSPLQQ